MLNEISIFPIETEFARRVIGILTVSWLLSTAEDDIKGKIGDIIEGGRQRPPEKSTIKDYPER